MLLSGENNDQNIPHDPFDFAGFDGFIPFGRREH
jgi:hypothetical protein